MSGYKHCSVFQSTAVFIIIFYVVKMAAEDCITEMIA